MAETLVLSLSAEVYSRLQERAAQLRKPMEKVSEEILEEALAKELPRRQVARRILEEAGELRPLGDELRGLIVRLDIPLEEVRAALGTWEGPSLSEIIIEQRGPRP